MKALRISLWCARGALGACIVALACSQKDASIPIGEGNGRAGSGAEEPAPAMTTESNQPAPNEGPPGDVPLQNPGGSGGRGSASGSAAAASSAPIDPTASGAVPCGGASTFCEAPNLTCCTPAAAAGAAAATCVSAAARCPTGTLSIAACSSRASCDADQVCCRSNNPPPMGGGAMGGGAMGGGALGGGNNGTSASCETACAMGAVQLCKADAECGQGNICGNNDQCVPGCTGVAGSCADGQLCCRGNAGGGNGGGGGAVPACVAPAAAGGCPAGNRQACTEDSDCPDGNACAPVPAGGGGGGATVLACVCAPGGCGDGQICCVGAAGGGGGGGAQANVPACVAPTAAGVCPGAALLSCRSDDDCSTPGTECLPPPGNAAGPLACRVPPAAPDAGN